MSSLGSSRTSTEAPFRNMQAMRKRFQSVYSRGQRSSAVLPFVSPFSAVGSRARLGPTGGPWRPGTGCCRTACGGHSGRASLGSLSARLGMGRGGSRKASPLEDTQDRQRGETRSDVGRDAAGRLDAQAREEVARKEGGTNRSWDASEWMELSAIMCR